MPWQTAIKTTKRRVRQSKRGHGTIQYVERTTSETVKTAPVREDRRPRVLVGGGLELDSLNDLVELELGELVVLLAIGVVLGKERLGLLETALLDCAFVVVFSGVVVGRREGGADHLLSHRGDSGT